MINMTIIIHASMREFALAALNNNPTGPSPMAINT